MNLSNESKRNVSPKGAAKVCPKAMIKICPKATAKTCQNQMSFYVSRVGTARSKLLLISATVLCTTACVGVSDPVCFGFRVGFLLKLLV